MSTIKEKITLNLIIYYIIYLLMVSVIRYEYKTNLLISDLSIRVNKLELINKILNNFKKEYNWHIYKLNEIYKLNKIRYEKFFKNINKHFSSINLFWNMYYNNDELNIIIFNLYNLISNETNIEGEVFKATMLYVKKKKITSKQSREFEFILDSDKNYKIYNNDKFKLIGFHIFQICFKLIPLSHKSNKDKNNINLKEWKEVYITEKLSDLVKDKICPFFVIYYNYLYCNNMKSKYYNNKHIQQIFSNKDKINTVKKNIGILESALKKIDSVGKYKKFKYLFQSELIKNKKNFKKISSEYKNFGQSAIFLQIEYCHSDLKKFLLKDNMNNTILFNILFQILYACLCMQKKLSILHLDLHANNILINNCLIEKYKFIINKKEYITLINGIIIKIIDFGKSYSFEFNKELEIKNKFKKQIIRFFKKDFESTKDNEKFNNNLINKKNIKQFIYSFDLWRICHYLNYIISENSFDNIDEFKNLLKILMHNTKKKCVDDIINPPEKIDSNYFQAEEILENYFYTKKQFREKDDSSIKHTFSI